MEPTPEPILTEPISEDPIPPEPTPPEPPPPEPSPPDPNVNITSSHVVAITLRNDSSPGVMLRQLADLLDSYQAQGPLELWDVQSDTTPTPQGAVADSVTVRISLRGAQALTL